MAKDRPGPKASGDMADIIDLMLATGARIGEVLALRWRDVDLDAARPSLTISGTVDRAWQEHLPQTNLEIVRPLGGGSLARVRGRGPSATAR